jgi:RNA ligase
VTDLSVLDSATKYPSIETYHALDSQNGRLTEPAMPFTGNVVLTEKVDGTNGRIILLPDGDYVIGARDSLLYAKGDRILNPSLGIVATLKPLADPLAARGLGGGDQQAVRVLFLEVYGGKVGGNAKQYSTTGLHGYRLFDCATVTREVLAWPRERIASWREHGGQEWATEAQLQQISAARDIPLTPRLGVVPALELPSTLEDAHKWLAEILPTTNVALDEGALGRPEGVVLRGDDRSVIAKARLQDYERTLKPQARGRKADR